MKIISLKTEELSDIDKKDISKLQEFCFGHINKEEIEKHFFPKGFAWILAYDNNKLVGIMELHKRENIFEEMKFLLGGIAGVCVCKDCRGKGIGSDIVKEGLKVLLNEGCDIACMTVDLENPMYGFYEKLGFKMIDRKISFEDIDGNMVYDDGTMFIPINNEDIYNSIMDSNTTFHYGKGYW